MSKNLYKNITTSLPIDIINLLNKSSKSLQKNKNEIIIESILLWEKRYQQQELACSYQQAKHDPEWRDLSEVVIDDYEY